jgi:hypothetical protein
MNESPKYEIYVSIDVAPTKKTNNNIDITLTQNVINMKDKISSQVNKLNAKCINQNNNLVQIFQSLREGKSATKFNIKNNRKMLKDSAKKNGKRVEDLRTGGFAPLIQLTSKAYVPTESPKKLGGNTTHRRKHLSRNKTIKLVR